LERLDQAARERSTLLVYLRMDSRLATLRPTRDSKRCSAESVFRAAEDCWSGGRSPGSAMPPLVTVS